MFPHRHHSWTRGLFIEASYQTRKLLARFDRDAHDVTYPADLWG